MDIEGDRLPCHGKANANWEAFLKLWRVTNIISVYLSTVGEKKFLLL